jgi:hypothetical protein
MHERSLRLEQSYLQLRTGRRDIHVRALDALRLPFISYASLDLLSLDVMQIGPVMYFGKNLENDWAQRLDRYAHCFSAVKRTRTIKQLIKDETGLIDGATEYILPELLEFAIVARPRVVWMLGILLYFPNCQGYRKSRKSCS